MVKSIITDDMETCYFCGQSKEHIHHVLFGAGRRKTSDDSGFIVPLCGHCHNMSSEGVHFSRVKDLLLRRICQLCYEREHTREEWMRISGRNYL